MTSANNEKIDSHLVSKRCVFFLHDDGDGNGNYDLHNEGHNAQHWQNKGGISIHAPTFPFIRDGLKGEEAMMTGLLQSKEKN